MDFDDIFSEFTYFDRKCSSNWINRLGDDTGIKKITWIYGGVKDEDVKHLVHILNNNTKVEEINLNDNFITDTGAKYIADLIKNNSTVKRIDLGYNSIGKEGIMEIIHALKENSVIEELIIDNNIKTDVYSLYQPMIDALKNKNNLKVMIDFKEENKPVQIVNLFNLRKS